VLVHASLGAVGQWVIGGATTVVLALRELLGPGGTLVVPAQNQDYVDPSRWPHGPVDPAWWPVIRDELPGFDPLLTPSLNMGVIAERVRTWPGALRSNHPHTSFAAIGSRAGELLRDHSLTSPLGDSSPLARLADVDARVLLLGVGWDRCTAFHLAESRLPGLAEREFSAPIATPAGRERLTYRAPILDSTDFAQLGAAFEADTAEVTTGTVGSAPCRLFPLAAAAQYASHWLPRHRPLPSPLSPLSPPIKE
jgi:aminoglycoside 3-N-acetyltransferase